MSTRRPIRVLAWLLSLVVVGAGGYVAYYFGYLDDYLCDGGSCATQDALPPKDLHFVAPISPRPVLGQPTGPVADPAKMKAAVLPLLGKKALGKHVGFAVMDLTRNRQIWSYGTGSFTPASTLKLFTSVAALHVVGADTRFATKVTRVGRNLTLVGGGDPYLTLRKSKASQAAYPKRAALSTLADGTVAKLRQADISSVRLAYDDSLFTGPAVNPRWAPQYITSFVTTPVSALWVDQGVVGYRRSTTPAQDAAEDFASLLRNRGIKVAKAPARGSAASQPELAKIESGTLAQIVQSLLERSDNQAAEVVLRQLAIAAGKEASFAGGTAAAQKTLTAMGVPWQGNRIYDGSGLARSDRVTVAATLSVLQHAHGMLADLPVAGFNGSLTTRFTGPGTSAGLGVVRAKTGTLSGVHSLAGVAVDKGGTSLAFVAMTDKVKLPQTLAARATLDRIASALAGCSCSR